MEPHRIVSVGKDNLVILQNLADGDQTIDHLCDAQIDVAPDGLIVFACRPLIQWVILLFQ